MTMYLFAIEEGLPAVIAEIVLTMSKGSVLGRQSQCIACIAFLPVELESRVIGGRSAFDHDVPLDGKRSKAQEIVSRAAIAEAPSTVTLRVELAPVLCADPSPGFVPMPAFGVDNLARGFDNQWNEKLR